MVRRIAAAAVMIAVLSAPGWGAAATLTPLDYDGLNLRAGPGTHHQVLTVLAAGETVTVLGYDGEWVRVRTPSGQEAWAAEWVSRVRYESGEAEAVVNTDVLNVRAGPGLDQTVRGVVTQGQRVALLETAGEWWRIRAPSGLEGWVYASYMMRAEEVVAPGGEAAPGEGGASGSGDGASGSGEVAGGPGDGGGASGSPGAIALTPPPAPEGTVPVMAVEPPSDTDLEGGDRKVVRSVADTEVYLGRDPAVFRVQDTVRAGERLTLLDAVDGWVRVETARGRRGWLPGSAVAIQEGPLRYEVREARWSVWTDGAPGPVGAGQPGTGGSGEYVAVRDADGLRLRQVPSLQAKVLTTLPQGEVLEVLKKRSVWLLVRTASGQKGWVHGNYTVPVSGGAGGGADEPGGASGAPALRATLEAVAEGVLRLTVEGEGLKAPQPEGTALFIPAVTGQQAPAVFPVGTDGVDFLSVTPDGVWLALERLPEVRVLEQKPDRVAVQLQPVLTAVAAEERADREVYRFQVQGYVEPRATAAGDEVIIDLPGAQAALITLAEGARVEPRDGGLRIRVQSRRAYALKRSEEGFELHLFKPGLAGKVILLDPGHGGRDAGAWNPALRLAEKEVNLAVALRLRAKLAELGATVLMTRATDVYPSPPELREAMAGEDRNQVDMGYRTRMANELKVDLFLSIHHNAGEGSGTETYFTSTTLNGERSRALARLAQEELVRGLGRRDRGAKDGMLFVTRNTDAPSALVEIAFVSHPVEAELIGQPAFQEKAAEALVRALERFFAERTE